MYVFAYLRFNFKTQDFSVTYGNEKPRKT